MEENLLGSQAHGSNVGRDSPLMSQLLRYDKPRLSDPSKAAVRARLGRGSYQTLWPLLVRARAELGRTAARQEPPAVRALLAQLQACVEAYRALEPHVPAGIRWLASRQRAALERTSGARLGAGAHWLLTTGPTQTLCLAGLQAREAAAVIEGAIQAVTRACMVWREAQGSGGVTDGPDAA